MMSAQAVFAPGRPGSLMGTSVVTFKRSVKGPQHRRFVGRQGPCRACVVEGVGGAIKEALPRPGGTWPGSAPWDSTRPAEGEDLLRRLEQFG
jgi:hypothetical protein